MMKYVVLRSLFVRTAQRLRPNWCIKEAADVESALEYIQAQQQQEERQSNYNVIFMDQYMTRSEPRLLGMGTVAALREKLGVRHSIICGLSANDLTEQFLHAGADAFVLLK